MSRPPTPYLKIMFSPLLRWFLKVFFNLVGLRWRKKFWLCKFFQINLYLGSSCATPSFFLCDNRKPCTKFRNKQILELLQMTSWKRTIFFNLRNPFISGDRKTRNESLKRAEETKTLLQNILEFPTQGGGGKKGPFVLNDLNKKGELKRGNFYPFFTANEEHIHLRIQIRIKRGCSLRNWKTRTTNNGHEV